MTNADPPIDFNSEASWSKARSIAQVLSPIPTSVSDAVLALWKNYQLVDPSPGGISAESYASVQRVDKTGKLKTPLYFAATALFPDKFEMVEDDTSQALLKILGPGLFATFLALVYCHRRLAKLCTVPEWGELSADLALTMELGYLLGTMVPELGRAEGALVCGLRHVVLGVYLFKNQDRFNRYKNSRKGRFDAEYEQQGWGCDHAQICALLLSGLGFRKDLFELATAIRTHTQTSAEDFSKLPPELKRWWACLRLVDSTRLGLPTDDATSHFPELKMSNDVIEHFKVEASTLVEHGTSFSWMLRSSKETPAET